MPYVQEVEQKTMHSPMVWHWMPRHWMPLTMPALSSVTVLWVMHDARAFQRLQWLHSNKLTGCIPTNYRALSSFSTAPHLLRFASMADMIYDAATRLRSWYSEFISDPF